MKGGIDCSLNISGVDCDQYCFYLVSGVPVSINWYKTVSKLYKNSYISNLVKGALRPDWTAIVGSSGHVCRQSHMARHYTAIAGKSSHLIQM